MYNQTVKSQLILGLANYNVVAQAANPVLLEGVEFSVNGIGLCIVIENGYCAIELENNFNGPVFTGSVDACVKWAAAWYYKQYALESFEMAERHDLVICLKLGAYDQGFREHMEFGTPDEVVGSIYEFGSI